MYWAPVTVKSPPVTRKFPTSSSTKGTSSNGNGMASYVSSGARSNLPKSSPYFKSSYGQVTYNGSSQSSKSRTLPDGPGPLPNKPKIDTASRTRYVAHSQSERTRAELPSYPERKVSREPCYGNTSGLKSHSGPGSKNYSSVSNSHNNYSHGSLASSGRKSKSLSHLGTSAKDETSARHIPRYSEYNPSTYQSNQTTTSRYAGRGNAVEPCYTAADYVSTSHSDYKDHYADFKELRSRARTERDPSSNSTAKNCIDRVHVRTKEMITASPTELKLSRRSSSSSCSTPVS